MRLMILPLQLKRTFNNSDANESAESFTSYLTKYLLAAPSGTELSEVPIRQKGMGFIFDSNAKYPLEPILENG